MAAAQLDQIETAKLLLDAHADVAAETIPLTAAENGVAMVQIHTGGRTALMYAAGNAHPALIRLLLDRGAKPGERDSSGRTACDYLRDNTALGESERKAAMGMLCRG